MFTTGFSDDSAYGYGLYNFEYKGISLLGHNGAGAGHRSFVLFAPELGFAVVTASNNEYFDPFVVAERAFELFLDLDPDWEPPQTATDPDSWAEYVGTYEDPVNVGTIVVTLAEDQKLYARFVDGSDTERRLYQYANDEFFYLFNGYNYIRFARDPVSEEPRFFANRYFVGDRVGSDPEGPAPNPREQVRMIVGQGAERELRVPGLKTGPE